MLQEKQKKSAKVDGMDNRLDIEKLLEEDKIVCIKVRGYSMYPFLLPGKDEVLVEKVDLSKVKRGDVVLYRRDQGILVLHRIWKRQGNDFFMVGDNQSEIEGPLNGHQIKGKMIAFIKNEKQISVKKISYRMISTIWLFLRPLRPFISKMIHWVKELKA